MAGINPKDSRIQTPYVFWKTELKMQYCMLSLNTSCLMYSDNSDIKKFANDGWVTKPQASY